MSLSSNQKSVKIVPQRPAGFNIETQKWEAIPLVLTPEIPESIFWIIPVLELPYGLYTNPGYLIVTEPEPPNYGIAIKAWRFDDPEMAASLDTKWHKQYVKPSFLERITDLIEIQVEFVENGFRRRTVWVPNSQNSYSGLGTQTYLQLEPQDSIWHSRTKQQVSFGQFMYECFGEIAMQKVSETPTAPKSKGIQ